MYSHSWGIHCQALRCRFAFLLNEEGIFLELFHGAGTDRVTAFHGKVVLDGGEAEGFTLLRNLGASGKRGIGSVAEAVGIEASSVSGAPRAFPAVAETQSNRTIRLTGEDPYRTLNSGTVGCDFYDVFILKVEVGSRFRANDYSVIPGKAGNRTGKFLQPTVI